MGKSEYGAASGAGGAPWCRRGCHAASLRCCAESKRQAAAADEDSLSVSSMNTAYSMGIESGQEVLHSDAERFSQAIDDTYESRWARWFARWRSCDSACDPCWAALVAAHGAAWPRALQAALLCCSACPTPRACWRRASTREKAWEALVAMLRNNVRSDDCYQK